MRWHFAKRHKFLRHFVVRDQGASNKVSHENNVIHGCYLYFSVDEFTQISLLNTKTWDVTYFPFTYNCRFLVLMQSF